RRGDLYRLRTLRGRVERHDLVGARLVVPDPPVGADGDAVRLAAVATGAGEVAHPPGGGIEPAQLAAGLVRVPPNAVTVPPPRRVRVTRLGRQRILLDDPGGGIEPAESTGEVPRVPHAAIRGDDDAVRPRCGSGCGVVRDLAGRGIEPTDVAVGLVRVPDDPVRADSGVVGESL